MKHLTAYIIAGLILSVALNVIQCDSAKDLRDHYDLNTELFQVYQKMKIKQISRMDSAISSLLNERKSDSLRHRSEQKSFISQINRLKSKVGGPAVVQDTIIIYQDSLIADLRNEVDTLYLTDNKAIDSLQKSKAEIFTMWQAEYQQRVKAQNRYDELRSRNFTAGPGIGIDITGRPTVNFSVQYKLVSFRIGRKR